MRGLIALAVVVTVLYFAYSGVSWFLNLGSTLGG